MRFSFTLLAVVASAVAVFASPAAENSGMHLFPYPRRVKHNLTFDSSSEGGIYKRGIHLSSHLIPASRPTIFKVD